jgi:hypothetical protein
MCICAFALFTDQFYRGVLSHTEAAQMGQLCCFWVLALGSILSHFQEHVRNLEFLSQRHTVAFTRGCGLASEEEEEEPDTQQQQQEDWECLWGYFRQHVGIGFGGLVAVALASLIAFCDIGGDGHLAAMKVMLASPLMLICCDRFVVSCSGQFARQPVGALPVLHLHYAFQCKRVLFGILRAKA